MDLQTSLQSLPGIGYVFYKKLERLGLKTVEDLITHYPFRYDDFSNLTSLNQANIGENVTLTGEIWSIKNVYTRSRKIITQAIFNDGSTPIELTWFNQSWLIKNIKAGDRLQVSGKLNKYKNKLTIIAPIWEKAVGIQNEKFRMQNSLHTGRLVPVYSETEGLSSKWLRTKIDHILPQVINQISDPLTEDIKEDLLSLPEALTKIHFPGSLDEAKKARDRLAFDELFFINLATLKAREEWRNKPLIDPLEINNYQLTINNFIKKLPFKLTKAQQRVIDEIMGDLGKNKPMNRLVQGEVGSGKTVVAAVVAYIVYLNGYKTLFMAPTEILAFQHHITLSKLLEPFGIKVGIYTGSKKQVHGSRLVGSSQKKKPSNELTNNQLTSNIIVGTHALLSNKLVDDNIGLIIVDEQQRFGVEQRTVLRNKAKIPHFLTMTATPIPRTVALTLYGDLDLSVIDELPKNRQKIKTHVVPNNKRQDAYKFIEKEVKDGGQVYIITPLIELSETLTSAKAAMAEFEKLRTQIFPDLKLGLLHGRLKSKEKEEVLNKFKEGKLDILVSTSVVEVGVDIPNATIMVIENAERFGLAQLHQLRGRVGRGKKQSYCLLFSSGEKEEVIRLKNLETIDNGLKLAELDLKIRGSGEIFGKKQSGRFELKIASFSDLELIEKTRTKAGKILSDDPKLENHPQLSVKLQNMSGSVMPD